MEAKQIKMNTKLITSCLLAISLLLSSRPTEAKNMGDKLEKEYNKTFAVSADDLVLLDNRFGNLTITHWNRDEVSILVIVKVEANSEKEAQACMDRISIELKKVGNSVLGTTNFTNENRNRRGENNDHFTINYFVNMPAKQPINLTLKYGNISLPEQNDGKSEIFLKYGNLKAGNFSKELDLEAKYSDLQLGKLGKGTLHIAYGGKVSIGESEQLDIYSQYTNLTLGKAKHMVLDQRYGNLKLESIESGTLEMKYSNAKIGYVYQQLDIETLDYGNVKITELSPKFKGIKANTRYGSLIIGIASKASFDLLAKNLKYGKCDIDGKDFNIQSTDNDHTKRMKINNGGSLIDFDANSYGKIKINQL